MKSTLSTLHSAAPPASRWPQIAVTAVFVVHGLLFASWTAHIPGVQGRLGLTYGTLGIALLGAPIGSICAMVASSYLIPRLGSRRVVQIALVGYCATGPVVGICASLPALMGALLVWGAFQGALDVAMNTQGITAERASGRMLMSGLHGSWSIGSFAGAGIGALAVGAGITLTPQLLVLGTLALLAAGLLTVRMLPDAAARPGTAGRRTTRRTRPARRGRIALVGRHAAPRRDRVRQHAVRGRRRQLVLGLPVRPSARAGAVPGLGYAAFALAMLAVRLSGNRLLSRYRPDRLLPALAMVATAGFAAALVIARPAAALAGFACLGIGLASVVPAVFSAAGRIPGLHPGTAVATASACGWAGYVCGPPLIGRLAALASLPAALGLLPVLTAFIVIGTSTARALKPRHHHGRPAAGDAPSPSR